MQVLTCNRLACAAVLPDVLDFGLQLHSAEQLSCQLRGELEKALQLARQAKAQGWTDAVSAFQPRLQQLEGCAHEVQAEGAAKDQAHR